MKIKLAVLLVILLAIGGSLYAQGNPGTLTGAGAPGGQMSTVVGTHYIDISASPPVLYFCSSTSIAAGPNPPAGTITCNWTAAGGGGISSVSSLNSGLSGPQQLFPNAPPYNINFDAHSCFGSHVSFPSGATPTITIDANCQPFTVGVPLKGFVTSCNSSLTCYTGAGGAVVIPMSTITPITATTATASGTATGASNGQNTFWYGTDQRAAWATVDTAFQATKGCADIRLPAGGSFIPLKIFNTVQIACGYVTVGNNESSALDAGNSIHGAGVSATKLVIPPDETMSCTTQPVANACMMAAMMGGGDFTITGGGNCQTNFPAGQSIWFPPNVAASTWWQNVTLTMFACTDANNPIGVNLGFSNKYDGIYSDSFGATNSIGAGGNNTMCVHCYFGETKNQPLVVNNGGSSTQVRLIDTYIGATQSTIGVDVNGGAGTVLTMELSQDYGAIGAGGAQLFVRTGNTLNLIGWYENQAAAYDIELQAGGIAHVRNSKFTASTHNWGTNGVALTTGAIFDEGGNTFSSNNNESTVQPVFTQLAGNGTMACSIAATCTNERGVMRLTAGTTTGTNPSFTMTFAGTFAGPSGSAPACTFQLAQTGTGSWVTAAPTSTGLPMVTANSTTAQTVGITTTVALVSTSTYDINYNCTPR